MIKKPIPLSFIAVLCFIISCKNDPVKPKPEPNKTTIDKDLLVGWWAPKITPERSIYFGADKFFFQDTLKKDSAPIAGEWQTSGDTLNCLPTLPGDAKLVFIVLKLTADSLIVKYHNSTFAYHKVNRPAFTSQPIVTIAGTDRSGYQGDGGLATNAQLSGSAGIVTDGEGNIYFCDRWNRVIRKISAADGKILTIAGTGSMKPAVNYPDNSVATTVDLIDPTFLIRDAVGNIYLTQSEFTNQIDKITPDGKISCIAGCSFNSGNFSGDGGPATAASLRSPQGIALDADGNLYFADIGNNRIRKISAINGRINTIAGTGIANYNGDGKLALNTNILPLDLSISSTGDIYFSDLINNRIRKITASTGIVTTVAGNGIKASTGDGGPAIQASVSVPFGIKISVTGDIFFVENDGTVRKIDGTTSIITKIAGTGYTGYTGDGAHATGYSLNTPYGIALDASEKFLYISQQGRIRKVKLK
jgi:hypothetical protein